MHDEAWIGTSDSEKFDGFMAGFGYRLADKIAIFYLSI